jgi:hypothetical protein
MKRMLHRTFPLLAALALLPAIPASAEEPQPVPPSKRGSPDRSDDRSPAKGEPRPATEGDEKAPPAPAEPKGGGRPPAPRVEKKDEKAPAKPAAEPEKPCVPVKPCAID